MTFGRRSPGSSSVAILAQEPFPVRTSPVFFPFTSFLVLPCPSVYNPVLVIPPDLMARTNDGADVPVSRYLLPLQIWVLLTVLFLTSMEQDTMQVRSKRKSMKSSYKLRSCRYSCRAFPDSKIASRRFPRQLPLMTRKLRILNKWSAVLQPVLPHWKRMQRLSPVDPDRQDLGIYSDIAMAPQPLGLSGPVALGHLMIIGIQDADLIPPQALLMNMREVQSYYDSHVNSTILELRGGSTLFGKGPTCQPTIDLLLSIVKPVPRRSGLYLNHEPNVKILLSDIKRKAIPYVIDSPSAAPIQISSCVNPNPLKTERLENNLQLCGGSWLTNSRFSSQRSARSQVLSILRIEETSLENLCSNLPPLEVDKHVCPWCSS